MKRNIIHTDEREKDVQALCNAVLNMSPNWWDNPNGAYESTCPMCYQKEYRGGNLLDGSALAEMNEIKHSPDCAYLIAKDLTTKNK